MKSELREVGDGCFAYLQLPGSWGYSNSGLIRSEGQSLMVDTLYDLRLTQDLLGAYARVNGGATPQTLVNTHANGDHCWGNQLLPSARIVASAAAAREMEELSPKLMSTLVAASKVLVAGGLPADRLLRLIGRLGLSKATALADAAPFVARNFGDFDFGAVALRLPTETFERALTLQVGSKQVELIEVGPAHTRGDVLVHVPADRVVFTGDILFEEAHPVMWEGPIENWMAACDRILALDVETVVPGHGPVTTKESLRKLRAYLGTLRDEARRAYDAGVSALDAARAMRHSVMPEWAEGERLAANVESLYRQFRGDHKQPHPLEMLAAMARLGRA